MTTNRSSTKKGLFSATVCTNKQIGERFYILGLEFNGSGAKAFADFQPGQFLQLDLTKAPLPQKIPDELIDAAQRNILLRRPFSSCNVTIEGKKNIIEILYCVVGPASVRMTALARGNTVSVIGPLGNGFGVPDGKKLALLVSGGMGAGPLEHLAKVLTNDFTKIEVIAFAGAKSAKELPFEKRLDEVSQSLGFSIREFAEYGIKSRVATDDGSAGFKGPVTECLLQWLSKSRRSPEEIIIYSCGPEAMLAKIAEIAKDKKIDCQVSMERRMACGFGVCQSCAVECKVPGSNETGYKLCCEDGPVFNSSEIVFSR